MLIGARTGAWAKSGGEPLPYDAELQYAIRGNYMNACLELPYKATEKTKYEISVRYLDRSTSRNLFGARDSATVANVSNNLNSIDFGNYSQTRMAFSVSSGDDLIVRNSASERSVSFNGGSEIKSTSAYTGSPFVSKNLCLGGVNGLGTYGMEGYYYYLKIWEDGTPVCDLIPVRVGDLAYWYDKVSKTLLDYCAAFSAGPDK